ncbi:MAG: M23 family metallopeptidase [Geminicoccaceae bacterium]
MKTWKLCSLLGAGLLAASPAAMAERQQPRFELPVTCAVGEDCWPVVYFDLDPSSSAADYHCGRLSYDGHTGTDIAVADMASVARGVPVVAAAPGVVRNVRDGMADVDVETIARESIEGRECGNGVAVTHADGWETLYCHLRSGSIAVAPGDRVAAGDTLGMIGMSGNASFPHVEFNVIHDGRKVDPFSGEGEGDANMSCLDHGSSLWSDGALKSLRYKPVELTKIGFATERPDWQAIKDGGYDSRQFPRDAGMLVVYIEGYALAAGDLLEVKILDPDGAVFHEQVIDAEKAQARFFRYTGRKAPQAGLMPGTYDVSVDWQDAGGHELTTGHASLAVK